MLIEMKITGLTIDPITSTPIVILKDIEEKKAIPIWIGLFEASAIATQLEKISFSRPMTHDLFISVLECLCASITKVLIDDLDGGIYYARLTLKSESKQSEIDARPSDCLALALRSHAPIEVQEKVVRESSISKSDVEKLISIENYLQ